MPDPKKQPDKTLTALNAILLVWLMLADLYRHLCDMISMDQLHVQDTLTHA